MSRVLLGFAFAGLAATAAMADGVDPTVIIRKVDPPPTAITSPNQTFNVIATAAHNVFAFQNDTGFLLTSLTLDLFAGKSGLVYSCGSFAGGDIFSTCSSTNGSNNDTILKFFGVGNGFSGIEAASCKKGDDESDDNDGEDDEKTVCTGGVYSLEFGGIPRGATVRGTGTVSAPEPMTAAMLLTGLVGLAGLRKRRKS